MAARAETARPVYPVPWYEGRVVSWITTTDHKRIGILYIATSLAFFLAGGVLALIIRTQLAQANADIVEPDTYNQLFTMHGTTMVFLVVVPILAGFANYLLPLMIGAADMAFPRLNAFSYWLFLFGGIVLYGSWFAADGAPSAGWTSYPPLSVETPGVGQDLWILSLHILSIASLAGAINFIVTTHNMRTAGMTWMRLPLFVWSILVYGYLLVAVLPVLSAGLTLMLLDRQVGTQLLLTRRGRERGPLPARLLVLRAPRGLHHDPAGDGDHLRGDPGVRAQADLRLHGDRDLDGRHRLLLDARLGPPHVHRRAADVPARLLHAQLDDHRGADRGSRSSTGSRPCGAETSASTRRCCSRSASSALFTIGGLSGIFVAAFPFDWQAHDTYFVVAHLHYVLFGGSMFAIFAGLYYWWPKMFGRRLGERLGKWHFWLTLIGFNLDLLPAAHARVARDAEARLHLPRRLALGGLQPGLDDRLVRHGRRHPALPRQRASGRAAARTRAPATTRGSPTRSSGTRPRRRRRTTSTASRT